MPEELVDCQVIERGDFTEYWKHSNLCCIIFTDGWLLRFNENDQLHHAHDPAVIKPDGSKFWYYNGFLHRENGPAIIRQNAEEYWQHGSRIK